jgi:hypothetical protein
MCCVCLKEYFRPRDITGTAALYVAIVTQYKENYSEIKMLYILRIPWLWCALLGCEFGWFGWGLVASGKI